VTFPSKILIIRHAEKPDDDDDIHLSPLGQKRAEALVTLFDDSQNGGRFPRISFIFATEASHKSNRPVETVAPLANALQLKVHDGFEDDEFKALASRLLKKDKYEHAVVLICWHHGKIPDLAKSLGVKSKQLPAKKFPDESFDQIWVLDYNQEGLVHIHVEAQGLSLA
jgi:broad specificity phosphatase PhoE